MRILVVDDELISRTKLSKILAEHGQCHSADHGEEALRLIEEALAQGQPYDLITLDVAMPGIDGKDLLGKIRRREQASPVSAGRSRILMVTAHAQRSLVVECIQFGCDDYLIKPIKPGEIKKKLRILGLLS